MSKIAGLGLLLCVAAGWPAAGQTLDNGGNSMLQGTYYFREVIYFLGDGQGDLNRAISLYGNLTFNGSGSYTMAVTAADSSAGTLQTGSFTGSYNISASGFGYITNPLFGGYNIYGLVSQQGIFVGSATETGVVNDMMIAAPLASPQPTNASFKGTYTIKSFDLSGGSPAYATNYQYQLNPDGAGNLGNVAISGYFGGGGSTVYSQSVSNPKYSFSNGGCNLAFPTNSNANFVSGQRFLYISADGNFVFGGSPTSWDMFIGIKTGASGTPNLGGLYYEAGFDENGGLLDSYYGSFTATGGLIADHQRTVSLLFNAVAYGATYADSYSVKSDGTYGNSIFNYLVSANGTMRIGSGVGGYIGLNVALAAPALTGTGVYLAPTGVVNAASLAPFTSGIAPGELLTLFGTNLAADLQIASSIPYPPSLGKVQVNINGLPAPIYYVSPTQISAIVPYAITGSVAQVQVNNNGTLSNTVSVLVNKTAPGIFTQNSTGLGYGAITHLDGTLVTTAHPAAIGETVSAYLTGLGVVNPLVPDGAAGPVSPLSQATNTITVDVTGTAATVSYVGLAPTLAGLYQINFTIPTGVATGDNFVDILGPDSYASQAMTSVGAATSAESAASAESVVPRKRTPRLPVVRDFPRATFGPEPGLGKIQTPLAPFPLPATGRESR